MIMHVQTRGPKQPGNVNTIMAVIMDEINDLTRNGVRVPARPGGVPAKLCKPLLLFVSADEPAMCDMLSRQSHTAYHGCFKCPETVCTQDLAKCTRTHVMHMTYNISSCTAVVNPGGEV